jgi:RNA polymerase sigma-70 factor (ECF subfamily)
VPSDALALDGLVAGRPYRPGEFPGRPGGFPGLPGCAASAEESVPKGAAKAAARAERHQEDALLVARTLRGDEDAFRRLVERYQKAVYWIAHDVLLDADEARDVAQEAFLRVHGALASYDPKREFASWLYRISRNVAIDALRRRRNRATPVEDLTSVPAGRGGDPEATDASAALEREEVRARVAAVLRDLPVEYRMALTLKELLGLEPRDIATITDTTYPTARWRLHRARLLFKKTWEERYGSPEGSSPGSSE